LVTALSVPDVVAKATTAFVGAAVGAPFESLSRKEIVDVDVPFAMIDVGSAVHVEPVADGGPATKVTVAVRVSGRPSTVAETVAEPTALGEVRTAV
jgi:hypothetical protein